MRELHCRRSELFQRELLAALQIVQRGDLSLRDLIGAYAGEIMREWNRSVVYRKTLVLFAEQLTAP